MMCCRASGRYSPVTLVFAVIPALLASPLLSAIASACSMAPCASMLLSPPASADVPLSAPAFLVKSRLWDVESLPILTSESFVIESQAGQPVPFHVADADDALMLVLDAPLNENTWYYLRYPEYCPGFWPLESPLELVRPFHAGWPAPALTGVPKVHFLSHEVESLVVFTQSGSCVAEVPADVVRFLLDMNSLASWQSLVRVETLVDGVRWARDEPGAPDVYGSPTGGGWGVGDRGGYHRPTVLFCRCGGSDHEDAGIAPGKHQVEVRLTVPGMAVQPDPAIFEVELGCPAQTEPGDGDAGADVPDAGAEDVAAEAVAEAVAEPVPEPTPDVPGDAAADPTPTPDPACGAPSATCPACASGCASGRVPASSAALSLLVVCFLLVRSGERRLAPSGSRHSRSQL